MRPVRVRCTAGDSAGCEISFCGTIFGAVFSTSNKKAGFRRSIVTDWSPRGFPITKVFDVLDLTRNGPS